MFKVNTMVLIIMVVLVTYRVHANPSISTSTPTPCYGDVVTLVCHHPEVASNPGRYFGTRPTWMEDSKIIEIADGTIYTDETVADFTQTFLTINITVDHFRNKSFNYSCLLVLAENGRPSGEVETSGEVTVDPVDQLPTPVNTATFSNSTTAVLTVSFDPRCCNTVQLTVDITTTSSSATTPVVLPVDSTDPTNTTIVITDVTEGVPYTASIQSVCEDNNFLEDSGVLVVEFMTYDEIDPNINGTDSTGQPSSPATTPVSVRLPIAIVVILMAVVILCTVIVTVGVVRWKRNHEQYRIPDGKEKLVLLQVCDALNRHNAAIHSVLGNTVSLHSPHEESPHTQSDIWGEYKERKFVAKFVYAITESDVEELIEEKRNSCSDTGFLLYNKKTISTFLGARLRQEDCGFVHVKSLPWKIGSREERKFVEAFNSHFLVSEGAVTDVLARGEAHSSRDFEQLLFALFPILNPNKESKSPLESNVRIERPSSPLSVQPHKGRCMHRRASFIDGVVSVLEILRVTILSVGKQCRRPQCQGFTNCTHMGEYRPDIHCQYKEKSFVVKCKVRHLDGAVTREDVEIIGRIREGVEAVCSCLVCDDLEMSEEVEKMLAPHNCLKAVVGLYSWNSMWVKNAIVALFQVLKMINTPPGIPVKSERWPQLHSPQKEFQSAVLAQLCRIGLDVLQERDDVIVGRYKGEYLVMLCVSAEEKITMGDVQTLLDARGKACVSIGFLICNQEMITYDPMQALKDNNCIHVLVGGYGKSMKWEDEMTRKFEEAFEAVMTPQEEVEGRRQFGKVNVDCHPQEPIKFSEEEKHLIPDNTEPFKSHSPLSDLLRPLPKIEDVPGSQKLNGCSANYHCENILLANDESQITLSNTCKCYQWTPIPCSQEQSENYANSEMVTGYSMGLPTNMIYYGTRPENNSFETDHDNWITFDIEPVDENNPCETYKCVMQTMDSQDRDKITDCDSGFVDYN